MHGCLAMGCCLVGLCYDDHRRTHLQTFLTERAVEAMVEGKTLVFKDDALQARSRELHLSPSVRKKGGAGEADRETGTGAGEERRQERED